MKFALLFLGAALLGACGSPQVGRGESDAERPTIVATSSVLASFVSLVVGDAAEVESLVPDGQDPHDHGLSARDAGSLGRADLIVRNGLGFDAGLDSHVRAARARGARVWTLTDHVTTVEGDPHVLVDPLAVAEAAENLAAAVGDATGKDLHARAVTAQSMLAGAGDETRRLMGVAVTRGCTLVTGHDVLGYFARRHGCTAVPVIGSVTSLGGASARGIEAATAVIEGPSGVSVVVVAEAGDPNDASLRVADRAGVDAVPVRLHSLPEDGSYLTFVLDIARAVSGGLSR